MSTIDEKDVPLAALFQRSLSYYDSTEQTTGSSATNSADSVQDVVQWLGECDSRIESLGLFSSNEEVEDVSSASLKYLLVPFLLAELQARTAERDPAARSLPLSQAKNSYSRFLARCDSYGLIPPEAKQDGPTDPQTRRALKIERFRKEKAAKQRLQDQRVAQMRSSLAKLQWEDGEDEDESAEGDTETDREVWLTRIELAVLKSSEQLLLLEQELALLSHASSLPPGERSKPAPPPTDLLQQLQKAASTLDSQSRARMAGDVFRPSHNLPTRSLEQQARIEMEQAARAEAAQQRAQAARQELEGDEEYQLQKQRAWDDWKDDNPRGAGNSKLKPTA